MRFFAIAAALVACASANDAIFLEGEEEPKEEVKVDAAYKAYLVTHAHHATELKAVCKDEEKAIEDAEEKTAALYGKAISCFKNKKLIAQGRTAVKSSETTIAGNADATDALKACGTSWDASAKTVQDADSYFRCAVQNKGANESYANWELEKIRGTVKSQEVVNKGLTFCKKTKATFDADKSNDNAVKLASCYRGVLKGGSATIIIVVVLLLAGIIAGGVYWYNASQKPDKDDEYTEVPDANNA